MVRIAKLSFIIKAVSPQYVTGEDYWTKAEYQIRVKPWPKWITPNAPVLQAHCMVWAIQMSDGTYSLVKNASSITPPKVVG